MPTISVIVPVYKVEPYLRRCVDSILAQTFTDFELILVDDGSPDNCGAICDEYAAKDERIYVIHQHNQGQAAARNHALDWVFANSNSRYITFIDSDDWVQPRYLELLKNGLIKFGSSICQCMHILTDGEESGHQVEEVYHCVTPKEEYLQYYSPYVWGKLYKRQVWQALRFPEGQIYEDLAIWYKLLFSQEIVAIVDCVLYYYFRNLNGTMRSNWHPGMLARMDAWDAQIDFFNNRGDKELVENAVKRYCHIAYGEYHDIEQSSRLTNEEKKENQAILARKIRKLMLNNPRRINRFLKR